MLVLEVRQHLRDEQDHDLLLLSRDGKDLQDVVVCGLCGVPIAQSRSGRWVHTDALPEKTPEHDAEPMEEKQFHSNVAEFMSLHDAAVDMLAHHGQLHPESDCEWALRLRRALGLQ